MRYFTSDTHFGSDSSVIIEREMRPFSGPADYTEQQVKIWNDIAGPDDTIYCIGDFCNYNKSEKDWISGLKVVQRVNAKVILITGNSEDRVIARYFDNDTFLFRDYCLGLGFEDAVPNMVINVAGRDFYLVHKPTQHRNDMLNLFGHTHRATGIWKPYGFNVGTDLNHFRPFTEQNIEYLIGMKEEWWDSDADNHCME